MFGIRDGNQLILSLISGLVGAVVAIVIDRFLDWRNSRAREKSNREALASEIATCGTFAAEFLSAHVLAPLYRLPTTCFQTSLRELLQLGKLTQNDAKALILYYSEVDTLNRGLDLAAAQYGGGLNVGHETKEANNQRNLGKATRIGTAGELYGPAMMAVGRAMRNRLQNGGTEVTQTTPQARKKFFSRLWDERTTRPIEFLTACMTLVGGIAGIATLVVISRQVDLIIRNQDAQAYENIFQSEFELDQFLATNSDLVPYFDENAPMPSDPKLARRVKAAAEYKMDGIDFFFSQAKYVRSQDYEFHAWEEYFDRSFSRSRVLCDVLRDEQAEYGSEINVIAYKRGCPGIHVTKEQIARVMKEFFGHSN